MCFTDSGATLFLLFGLDDEPSSLSTVVLFDFEHTDDEIFEGA